MKSFPGFLTGFFTNSLKSFFPPFLLKENDSRNWETAKAYMENAVALII